MERMPHRHIPVIRRLPLVALTHPFELALGALLIAIAVRGALAGQVTPSIDETLPAWPRLAYQTISAGAGVGILVGLITREKWAPGRGVEKASMCLAAGAFLGYAIVLGSTLGWVAFVNVATAIVIGVACLCRAIAIHLSERLTLNAVRHQLRTEEDDRE